ncbi:MAG: accessory gene regulator B family protein [Oscillospiraceae bacterium]|nr:accessory gene regulator B family protein [Oscillospiraceae bacterium]
MINALSRRIAKHLCETSIIEESDLELYAYGFFVLLSRILFLIITTIFGMCFNIIFESILFYILFCFIRSYAGGVHAPNEFLCTVFTTLLMFVCVLIIKLLIIFDAQKITSAVYFISFVIIIIFSPLDTKEKPLNKNEKKCYRIKTYIVLAVILFISTTTTFFSKKNIFYVCLMSLSLESFLLVLGKIKSVIANNKNECKKKR